MGPCNEANAGQSAFVEGAILTADGQLTLYDPLVIDQGTQPAAPTVAAQVPPACFLATSHPSPETSSLAAMLPAKGNKQNDVRLEPNGLRS